MITHSNSVEATMALGREIGHRLKAGDLVALYGELGSGKTEFVKGLAEGLEVPECITSPTFILAARHMGRCEFYHVDAYRLDSPSEDEVREIGLLEILGGAGVCAIEWADCVERWLPAERLEVHLNHTETGRQIRLVPLGDRYSALLGELKRRATAGD